MIETIHCVCFASSTIYNAVHWILNDLGISLKCVRCKKVYLVWWCELKPVNTELNCVCVSFTVVVGQMDQNKFFFWNGRPLKTTIKDCASETKNQITRKSHWTCCVWLNLFVYVWMWVRVFFLCVHFQNVTELFYFHFCPIIEDSIHCWLYDFIWLLVDSTVNRCALPQQATNFHDSIRMKTTDIFFLLLR